MIYLCETIEYLRLGHTPTFAPTDDRKMGGGACVDMDSK